MKMGEDAELLDFAQELLDSGHVAEENVEALERIAGLAQTKESAAPPLEDPFKPMGMQPPLGKAGAGAPSPVASRAPMVVGPAAALAVI
jgi:hypothetical protein